jgi:hypothetical protein
VRDAFTTLGPLFALMLIPVWIPLIAETVGWVVDLFGVRRPNELAERVAAVKERSRAGRTPRAEVVFVEAA